jgi:hypothetical protein
MWLFNQQSAAAKTALVYITTGALIVTWTGVWYLYLLNHPPTNTATFYWMTGFLLTGLVLCAIGFGVGRIGRSAKQAEQPTAVGGPEAVVGPAVNGTAPAAPVVSSAPATAATMPTESAGTPNGPPISTTSTVGSP